LVIPEGNADLSTIVKQILTDLATISSDVPAIKAKVNASTGPKVCWSFIVFQLIRSSKDM